MTGDATAEWVRWWCCTWHWAHPDWQTQFASGPGEDMHRYDAVARSQHNRFLLSVGISPGQPPPPNNDVLQWLALTEQQQQEALALIQMICFSRTPSPSVDAVSHEQWCRRVAKALRPGVWLSPTVVDVRELLGAWLGDAYWSRLRLAWPPGVVDETPSHAPVNKLNTLWQAVLWRVTNLE
ncbi:type III secretion protein [Pseudomonas sp.]|uniref:type III secretion protein n=1 Tax=Pseudomonas sp. TaxID=306 RepID=UPI002631A8F0|nr:type III secretion protein [Pseudomonas sp.]